MYVKCHYCSCYQTPGSYPEFYMAKMTNWYPPSGYDPLLRQFKCPNCHQIFYMAITEAQRESEKAYC